MSFSKKIIKVLSYVFQQEEKKKVQKYKEILAEIESKSFTNLIEIKTTTDLIVFLEKFKRADSLDAISFSVIQKSSAEQELEMKVNFLVHRALGEMKILLNKESLRLELDDIKSKGRGRPTKEEAKRIRVINEFLLEGKRVSVSVNMRSSFANYIEILAKEEGSYNKAYQRYADEINAENPEKTIQHVTIRRRFERYKKERE